ncbi:hypothetical protein, partial [Erwinia sp. ErVv1]|uniref:hypothetical protein n=1 Tax=Erwinia sp. ErVv1 TaxID=1603299 RepID=UPI001E4F86D5
TNPVAEEVSSQLDQLNCAHKTSVSKQILPLSFFGSIFQPLRKSPLILRTTAFIVPACRDSEGVQLRAG